MSVCFNFECSFREDDRSVYVVWFNTWDNTKWRVSEKWRQSSNDKVGMQQRLTFHKQNHFDKHYDIQVDIFSIKHNAKGVIRRFRRAKPIKSTFTTSLLHLQGLRYDEYSGEQKVAGIKIKEGVLTDVFRYKVTVRMATQLLRFPRLDHRMIFADQIRSLLESKIFADGQIRHSNDFYSIHKCILMCRSSLFFTIYESERFGEKPQEFVDVSNIGKKIMKKTLLFIYGGLLAPVDIALGVKLFDAAVEFEMEYFKDACRRIIEDIMDPLQAVNMLYIANLYKDEGLKEICQTNIAINLDYVAAFDPKWKHVQQEFPQDMPQILTLYRALNCTETVEFRGSPELLSREHKRLKYG